MQTLTTIARRIVTTITRIFPLTCPECGQPVLGEWTYCEECGHQLRTRRDEDLMPLDPEVVG